MMDKLIIAVLAVNLAVHCYSPYKTPNKFWAGAWAAYGVIYLSQAIAKFLA